jgi:hypothetical protein
LQRSLGAPEWRLLKMVVTRIWRCGFSFFDKLCDPWFKETLDVNIPTFWLGARVCEARAWRTSNEHRLWRGHHVRLYLGEIQFLSSWS